MRSPLVLTTQQQSSSFWDKTPCKIFERMLCSWDGTQQLVSGLKRYGLRDSFIEFNCSATSDEVGIFLLRVKQKKEPCLRKLKHNWSYPKGRDKLKKWKKLLTLVTIARQNESDKFILKLKSYFHEHFKMILRRCFYKGNIFLSIPASYVVWIDNFVICVNYQPVTRECYVYIKWLHIPQYGIEVAFSKMSLWLLSPSLSYWEC